MTKIDPFDLPDSDESGGEAECPSCGIIPSLDGPTPGCNDPIGCGVGKDIDPELEDAETNKDEDPWEDYDEDEYYDDEEEDELEELDFE